MKENLFRNRHIDFVETEKECDNFETDKEQCGRASGVIDGLVWVMKTLEWKKCGTKMESVKFLQTGPISNWNWIAVSLRRTY